MAKSYAFTIMIPLCKLLKYLTNAKIIIEKKKKKTHAAY